MSPLSEVIFSVVIIRKWVFFHGNIMHLETLFLTRFGIKLIIGAFQQHVFKASMYQQKICYNLFA